jgi:hypothetical protein
MGPYSPKIDDSTYVSIYKEWMEDNMEGAVIIGDCGYEQVAKEFSKIKMVTTKSKPKGRPKKDGSGVRKLTKMQEKRNSKLKKLRSRVESPFGEIKQRWNSLSTCFKEDDKQHGHVVNIALAIRNLEKK